MTLRLRPEAEADILRIARHIAADDPRAALNWIDAVQHRCRALSQNPGMGVSRPDVRPELRMFPLGNYLILYRGIEGGAEIVRVVHGARRWQDLL
ncbi:type II toxin-antitoxin system RelE/ParE family toxin [Chenggangzhangella methanolivorans]|uniref:Type II toxin-antitoxin system RelE/ParE family toxin n=1 Tax=Chenggangzhangella methanolivorans TaxID=1437009 RepID=A0A9E6RAS0_9HYPH|nr:type II toxin-antitoxin system RelE/ParE family toxin [Chenggangzhangella methanolivorans]QZO00925.1 type II toxin-antitoxin system RelE/ParE family toxin [Chenggangzhangella methanolivorans]